MDSDQGLQLRMASDGERKTSPIVTAFVVLAASTIWLGVERAQLAVLGAGLTILGLLLLPTWWRWPIIKAIDDRWSQRASVLDQPQRCEQRRRRIHATLPKVRRAVIAAACLSFVTADALVAARIGSITVGVRTALALLLIVEVVFTSCIAYRLLTPYIARHSLSRVGQLHLDPAITAANTADRLEQGWQPLIGQILLCLSGLCTAAAPLLPITPFPLWH